MNGPLLTELLSGGEGRRFAIGSGVQYMGADASRCRILIEDDPLVNSVHACVERDEAGVWTIQDMQSRNGVWVRVEEERFSDRCEVQCGEQWILLQVVP